MKDYQTKKGRLTKKKGNEHFKPELDDDFFGFSLEEIEMPFWKQVFITIGMLAVLYVALYVLFTITPNI